VQTDSRLTAARSAFVNALADGAARGLEHTARELERFGMVLLAGEAYARTAELHTAAGDSRAATTAQRRARALARKSPGAVLPVLGQLPAEAPLTAREREIALLVARKLSSREVADRLGISVRTVDDHLQQIYGKFGIRNREQLHGIARPCNSQ
jgi:DNA-binding CsgD family transcriptional regulator